MAVNGPLFEEDEDFQVVEKCVIPQHYVLKGLLTIFSVLERSCSSPWYREMLSYAHRACICCTYKNYHKKAFFIELTA